MKKLLLSIIFIIIAVNIFSYTSIFFFQDFNDLPVGIFNLTVLESNDDGTHGNNDESATHFATQGDKRVYIDSTAKISVEEENGEKLLHIIADKGEKAVFSVKNMPVQVNTNHILQYNFFIPSPVRDDFSFVIFSNSLNEKSERIEAIYSQGQIKIFKYRKGQKENPELLYSVKRNLINRWFYTKTICRDREISLYIDNRMVFKASVSVMELPDIWIGINQKESGTSSLNIEIDNLSTAHGR